jgi:PRTRC genetic system ThiF family protein
MARTTDRIVHKFKRLHHNRLYIALIGCGGNGAQMLTKLARLNYALRECGYDGFEVDVFDPDRVSGSNVGRQAFSPSDVGQFKASVLVNRVNAYYGTNWRATNTKATGHFGDIAVSCVDTARARREIYAAYSQTLRSSYWMDLGNTRLTGQVIIGQIRPQSWDQRKSGAQPERLPHVIDLHPEILDKRRKEASAPTCSVAEALDRQSLFINDMVTSAAAQILDDLLRIGEIAVHGYYLNMETGRMFPVPIPEACATTVKRRKAA